MENTESTVEQGNQTITQSQEQASSIPNLLSIKEEGAGKAYQSVAQSTAIAVQDAADHLRNINTISTTALGVAMAQFLETGDAKHAQAIELAQNMTNKAAENFLLVGANAAKVLSTFPSK